MSQGQNDNAVARADVLKTDARSTPLGIDNTQPQFSWQVPGEAHQIAYEIQVATSPDFLSGVVWQTGRVDARDQVGALNIFEQLGPLWGRLATVVGRVLMR